MHPALRVYFQGALKQDPLKPDDIGEPLHLLTNSAC